MECLFGYGSLMNPLSLAGRDTDYSNINERYEKEVRLEQNWNVKSEINSFEELCNNGLNIYPVKVNGFKRYYNLKHRGSGMLEIHKREQDMINGILYTNVPESIYKSVINSESKYKINKVQTDNLIYYKNKPNKNSDVSIFTPKKSELRTDLSRHNIYHNGILRGFTYLYNTSYISNNILNNFIVDFLETTYECRDNEWKSLRQIDGLKDFERVKDIVEQKEYEYYETKPDKYKN